MYIWGILRQNTKFSAKSSPSIENEKTLANLVDYKSIGKKMARKIRLSWSVESSK
jgi:hypothetical protein